MNYNDSLVQLIKNLSQNMDDDTDPNNVILQQFQAPYESNAQGETVTTTSWSGCPQWGGQGITPNFNWNQGGRYAQKMEVFKCLMLI